MRVELTYSLTPAGGIGLRLRPLRSASVRFRLRSTDSLGCVVSWAVPLAEESVRLEGRRRIGWRSAVRLRNHTTSSRTHPPGAATGRSSNHRRPTNRETGGFLRRDGHSLTAANSRGNGSRSGRRSGEAEPLHRHARRSPPGSSLFGSLRGPVPAAFHGWREPAESAVAFATSTSRRSATSLHVVAAPGRTGPTLCTSLPPKPLGPPRESFLFKSERGAASPLARFASPVADLR